MSITKGNGPDATNDRPAKIQTNNATDFIAACARMASIRALFHAETQASTSSPALMFLSQDCSKADVSDVSGVQAFIHAGFSRYGTDTADVSDVSASDGAVLNPLLSVFIRTGKYQLIQALYFSAQSPRRVFRAGAGRIAGLAGDANRRCRHRRCAASRCCDKVPATPEMGPVLENIVIDSGAFTHALSWVFSRQKFTDTGFPASHGFRRDGLDRKAGRMAESMFSTSRHPLLLKRQRVVFQSHSGVETMTTTTPKMGILGTTPATSPATLVRRLAIEAALSAALHLVRTTGTQHGIQAATGRAIRAASMLKQACAEAKTTGSAA